MVRRLVRPLLAAALAATVLGALVVPSAWAGPGPTPRAVPDGPRPAGPVTQIGTYATLAAGGFGPVASIGQVLDGPRTIGLGTFVDLDGELVILAGVAYRVGTDGRPRPVPASTATPFTEAVAFASTVDVPVAPGTTCAALDAVVAELAGADGMTAVRVRGTFADLVTRSVPAQRGPSASLAGAVAAQQVFDLGARRAVLVGFRAGPAVGGLAAPGLHLHGLTVDRSAGGHVLSCVAGGDVALSVEPVSAVRVVVPVRR